MKLTKQVKIKIFKITFHLFKYLSIESFENYQPIVDASTTIIKNSCPRVTEFIR